MIEVKDNLCYGRKSAEITFKIDIKRDIFESSYDDTILRDAIFTMITRKLYKELDEMYFKYFYKKT